MKGQRNISLFGTTEICQDYANGWSQYLELRLAPHFYHDWRWREVIEKSFEHKPFYLMASDETKKTVGILPLFLIKSKIMSPCLVSIPFLNYGGMITDSEEVAKQLLDKAAEIAQKENVFYIEMRQWNRSPLPLVTREHKVTMLLDLTKDSEEQWERLDKKVRNQIRKAEKSDLKCKQGKAELLDDFYKVYSRTMRDLGTPVMGKIFFENILKYFPVESHIFTVLHNNQPIAGAFTLVHDKTMEIPWASALHSFNPLCANMLLYWEAIKSAISLGCSQFDFGRGTKDGGTYHFKKQWGTTEKQLYWQYWTENESKLPSINPQKTSFSLPVRLWQKLPLFVTNRLGPLLARQIPTF